MKSVCVLTTHEMKYLKKERINRIIPLKGKWWQRWHQRAGVLLGALRAVLLLRALDVRGLGFRRWQTWVRGYLATNLDRVPATERFLDSQEPRL